MVTSWGQVDMEVGEEGNRVFLGGGMVVALDLVLH